MNNILIGLHDENIEIVKDYFEDARNRHVLFVDCGNFRNFDSLLPLLSDYFGAYRVSGRQRNFPNSPNGNYIQYVDETETTDTWIKLYDIIVFAYDVSEENIERFSRFLISTPKTPIDHSSTFEELDLDELFAIIM